MEGNRETNTKVCKWICADSSCTWVFGTRESLINDYYIVIISYNIILNSKIWRESRKSFSESTEDFIKSKHSK